MKPRQPVSYLLHANGLHRCQFRQTEVLEDERASLLPFCPFLFTRRGNFIFFLKEVIDDKHVYEFAKPALHL
jgi:hypothetical protein